jgi:DNA-binding transcriptional LysR family regulator
MDIRQLRYLVALARDKHFKRAAEKCHVTQPTLSSRIRQLEEELGVPIVKRGQRYLGLTPEGETVLKWAHAILDNCTSLQQELGRMREGLSGRLTLGVIPTALLFTPKLTAAMEKVHPRLGFKILSMTSIEILERLKERAIDIGISYLDNEPIDFHATLPLYRERPCLVVRNDHPLARRNSVSWREAAEEPLSLLNGEMQNRRIIDRTFRQVGAEPQCRVETTSIANILAHIVNAGPASRLAGIVPDIFLDSIGPMPAIVSLRLIEPDVTHEVGLIAADRSPMPPAIDAMFEISRGL